MCFGAEVLVTDGAGDRERFLVLHACLVAVQAQPGALVRLDVAKDQRVVGGPRHLQRLGEVGAGLVVGTDIARPFNPMTNVWGIVTRSTKSAGIQGPEHAISMGSALELYTMGTARLNHEQGRLGSITPGKLADLVGYPLDPLSADPDDLAELTPAFTIAGGRATHDPDKRLAR